MLRARARAVFVALAASTGIALVACAAYASGTRLLTSPAAQDRLVGRIVIAHQDGRSVGGTRIDTLLSTADGLVSLRLPDGLPAPPGARISIDRPSFLDGAVIGGGIARLGPPAPPFGDSTLGPANFTPGIRKVLVLLAQIQGQAAPGSADVVRKVVFTAPNSANAFIREETFGQLSLTGKLRGDGDVYGPYLIPDATPGTCNTVKWGVAAEAAFKAAVKLDPETWDNVVVVFQSTACNFSGEGEIGQLQPGKARHAWINPTLTGGVPTTSVVAHELGHNLGVDHAGAFDCVAGGARVPFSDACASDPAQMSNQYLDPFDVMGTGLRQESAYHKWESGWLPPSAALTVVRNGTYLIAPEETSSAGLQLLEVPRDVSVPSYWLDFRQPLGTFFDNFSPTDPAVNGVTIRYANSSGMIHPSKSWLIDTTPGTPTFADAPLAVGQTYSDPTRGVSIGALSTSPLGVLVRITVANGADSSPPGRPGGLSVTRAADGLHFAWTSASDDSGTVQRYRLRRNGVLLADVYATSAGDPTPLSGRTSSYDVSAVDPAGNEGSAARIDVSISDTLAPTAPCDLAATVSGSTVHLSWRPAADDVGVASYEVDRDGQAIAYGLQATEAGDLLVPVGPHSYTVRAIDSSGNAGAFSAPLTATVLGDPPVVVVVPPPVATARVKRVSTVKLRRVGKHRVLVSWKAQRGAHRYQVLRAGKKATLLATVKKVQYVDGKAPKGKLKRSRYIVRALLS